MTTCAFVEDRWRNRTPYGWVKGPLLPQASFTLPVHELVLPDGLEPSISRLSGERPGR
jgi:hypothetical protein